MLKVIFSVLLIGFFISIGRFPAHAVTSSSKSVSQPNVIECTGFFGGIRHRDRLVIILSAGVTKRFTVDAATQVKGWTGGLVSMPINTPIHITVRNGHVAEVDVMGRTQ
jgi:hypothetical protein